MKSISLKDLVAAKGQAEVARLFGVTAPAIKKALSSDRDIRCVPKADGTYEAEEVRPFPSQKKQAA